MRILWHSAAPWCPSGYGQQTAQAVRRLVAAGHDVAISSHFGLEGGKLRWEGVDVYPGDRELGNRLLPRWIEHVRPELVVTLLDVWAMKPEAFAGAPRVACWLPIDHEPLAQPLATFLSATGATPMAMSRHGERVLADAALPPLYVPHAIDTAVYRPVPREEARAALRLPQEAFLVGMVAANVDKAPARKAWPEALAAFARFRATHPDALLYLHTDLAGAQGGINLAWLCERLDLGPEALRGTPPLSYDLGLEPGHMALLYSAFDVLLSPSYGEGFGLAPLEAQACGTPVIVSDFSAQAELCAPTGWRVAGEPFYVNAFRAWWQRPDVDAIADALEQAYDHDLGFRGRETREFALAYDADRVFEEHWQPALAALEPAKPNRKLRRALAKAGA